MVRTSLGRRHTVSQPTPNDGSPFFGNGKKSPRRSLSSRKSLSNLFTWRDSPQGPESFEDGDDVDASDQVSVKAGTITSSPSKQVKTVSGSLSRSISGSLSKGRGLLSWTSTWFKGKPEPAKPSTPISPITNTKSGDEEEAKQPVQLSPRKVHFVADVPSQESTPIDIPKKNLLPPLNLSAIPFMDTLGHTDSDPIPTARPPDTPVLMAHVDKKDDYFSPLPRQEGVDTAVNQTISPDKAELKEEAVQTVTQSEPVDDTEATMHSPGPKVVDHMNEITASSTALRASLQLKNIAALKDARTDNSDSDIFSQRELLQGATCEDIRHRFKVRSSHGEGPGWRSPGSDSSSPLSPAEPFEVSIRPIPHHPNLESLPRRSELVSADESEISAVRKDLESMSLVDPVKQEAPASDEMTQPVIQKVVDAPKTLEPTVSAITQARPPRQWRFSNKFEHKTDGEAVSSTSFAWKACQENQTPSPVSIPLPPSVAQSKTGRKAKQFSMAPNDLEWCPNDEPGFAYALATATADADGVKHVKELLAREGGFATFWKDKYLPKWTAPGKGVLPRQPSETANMIVKAWETCKMPDRSFNSNGWSPFDDLDFSGALVAFNHALGLENVHRFLSSKDGFKNLWAELDLPDESAPKGETRELTYDECSRLVRDAWDICGHSAPHTDQHGWLPFHETQFPSTLLGAISDFGEDNVCHILTAEGGFAEFWRKLALPHNTAPQDDTKALTHPEFERMVSQLRKLCASDSSVVHSKDPYPPTMVRDHRPYKASNENCFSPLGSMDMSPSYYSSTESATSGSTASAHSHRQYSGEVSTASEDNNQEHSREHTESSATVSCSDCKSHHERSDPCQSQADDEELSFEDADYDDNKENKPPLTPQGRVAAAPANITPKPRMSVLNRSPAIYRKTHKSPRRLMMSTDSLESLSGSIACSEDERFARHIV